MSERSVNTDALATLGTILTEPQKRDAIHLAVLPATAGQTLDPGTHILMIDDSKLGKVAVKAINGDTPHGIVDPFLIQPVKRGEQFWFVIYPRVITSLRHVWSHPAFPDEPEAGQEKAQEEALAKRKKESERWLRNFCKNADCAPYENILEAVRDGSAPLTDGRQNPTVWGTVRFNGDSIHHEGSDAHGEIPPEFWEHMEVVLGRPIQRDTDTYFSCSC